MVLAIEELSALEDEIMSVLPDRITAILSKLNRSWNVGRTSGTTRYGRFAETGAGFLFIQRGKNCRCRWYGCKGRGITQYR